MFEEYRRGVMATCFSAARILSGAIGECEPMGVGAARIILHEHVHLSLCERQQERAPFHASED